MNRKSIENELDEENANAKKIKLDNEETETEIFLNEHDADNLVSKDNGAIFGIVERINKGFKRFSGLIKQSASDFMVNEIDMEGNIVRLTNFDLPEVQQTNKESKEVVDINETLEKLKLITGVEEFENLIKFLESNKKNETFKMKAPKEKSERKFIHDFIKSNYKQFNSNTTLEANVQFIDIAHQNSNRTSAKDCYKNFKQSNEIGDFKICECALYKENIDTIQAVSLISRNLRINVKRMGYAGTKDKRAKTTQKLSFFRIEPKQLLRLNNCFHNIKLGNFKLRNGDSLKLGDLSGNRFKLVIRDVDEKDKNVIVNGIESLKKDGFINYFGLQRFGTCQEAPTHLIGKFLILNNIKEAIELILKPRKNSIEKQEIKLAREIWYSSKDARKALEYIERINCVENFLLTGLSNCDERDYLAAFQYLPRNMRLMYLHAYQSYIWNKAVTKRIELYGLNPVNGDLVKNKNLNDQNTEEIIVLNETNLNDYDIYDILLPLPGHNIIYPKNQIKDFYEEILKIDGIKIDGLKNKIKDFSLGGDYRNIIIKPSQLEYEIIDYNNKSIELTKSDWELIAQSNNPTVQSQNDKVSEGETFSRTGIVIEYNLPSSAYATMALREILKDE